MATPPDRTVPSYVMPVWGCNSFKTLRSALGFLLLPHPHEVNKFHIFSKIQFSPVNTFSIFPPSCFLMSMGETLTKKTTKTLKLRIYTYISLTPILALFFMADDNPMWIGSRVRIYMNLALAGPSITDVTMI